jgi:hypothetical protein
LASLLLSLTSRSPDDWILSAFSYRCSAMTSGWDRALSDYCLISFGFISVLSMRPSSLIKSGIDAPKSPCETLGVTSQPLSVSSLVGFFRETASFGYLGVIVVGSFLLLLLLYFFEVLARATLTEPLAVGVGLYA